MDDMQETSPGPARDAKSVGSDSSPANTNPRETDAVRSSAVGSQREKRSGASTGFWAETPKAMKLIISILGPIVLLLTVCALVYAIFVIFGIPRPAFMEHIGSAEGKGTGEIGDTFGGLLAPILTAGALGATVWFSKVQLDQTREHFDKALSNERAIADRQRAEKVVAWVAEGNSPQERNASILGIIIMNDAGALIHDFDIDISGNGKAEPIPQNREVAIAPGMWFVPFARSVDESSEIAWQQITQVAIDAGQMKALIPTTTFVEKERVIDEYLLTAHSQLREENGADDESVDLPFYWITRTRFELQGESWERDESGKLLTASKAPGSVWKVEQLQASAATVKPSLKVARQLGKRAKGPRRLIDLTLLRLSGITDENMLVNANKGLDASDGLLKDVEKVWAPIYPGKPQISSAMEIKLSNSAGLRFIKDKNFYPGKIDITPSNSQLSVYSDNGVTAKVLILNAGSVVYNAMTGKGSVHNTNRRGTQTGLFAADTLLTEEPDFWMENQAIWFAVLQAMVNKTNELIAEIGNSSDGSELVSSVISGLNASKGNQASLDADLPAKEEHGDA